MGARDGAWHCAMDRSRPWPHSADRRDRPRCPRGYGGGRVRPAADLASRATPGMDRHAKAAGMAEWRDRPGIFRRRPAKPARTAIRGGVVRRTRQVALCGGDVRHAAIRLEARHAAAATDHHHAASAAAAETAARRSAYAGDA